MDNGDFHFSLSTRTHTCGIRDFVEQIPGGWHARSQKEIARNAAESPRFPVKESTLKMCVCVCVCVCIGFEKVSSSKGSHREVWSAPCFKAPGLSFRATSHSPIPGKKEPLTSLRFRLMLPRYRNSLPSPLPPRESVLRNFKSSLFHRHKSVAHDSSRKESFGRGSSRSFQPDL